MNYKKNRKFKKISEKIWYGASKGILAGIMIVGANTTFAQATTDYTPQYAQSEGKSGGMHMMRQFNSFPKVNALAGQLGLDSNEIKQELKSGKTVKQILQEHGIAMNEIQKAFETKKRRSA
jgi:hypothetical protein